jgi:Flp pilus assembly protein TadG
MLMQRGWYPRLTDRRGTTSVEMALCFGIVATLLFGTIELGRLLWTRQVIMHVADMVTRCYSLSSPLCSGSNTPASYAASIAAADGLTISASNVTTSAAPSCSSQSGGNVQYYKISIGYEFSSPVARLLTLPATLSVTSQYGC